MQNLNIRLSVNPKCELVAIDDTDYNTLYDYESLIVDLTNYICLEFIVDNIGEISKDTIKFYEYPVVQNEFLIKNTSVFPLKKDGTFTYHKYLIPKLAHLLKTEDVEYYQSANQVYYNDGKIYFAESDYEKIEDLQINSIQITDLKKL